MRFYSKIIIFRFIYSLIFFQIKRQYSLHQNSLKFNLSAINLQTPHPFRSRMIKRVDDQKKGGEGES